jgi:hypothetical protein
MVMIAILLVAARDKRKANRRAVERIDGVSPSQSYDDGCGCAWTIFVLVVLLGGLWILVAVVKWMWEHS